MGGRLDATNIVEPVISIVTDISLDHMEWLGTTISAIAREKAGILRPGGTMITLPQHPEANQALGEVAIELHVKGVQCGSIHMPCGWQQSTLSRRSSGRANFGRVSVGWRTSASQCRACNSRGSRAGHQSWVSNQPAAVAEGIRLTSWPGRLERFESAGKTWVLDVAHNPAGAWALRSGLRAFLQGERPRTLIFSCLRDKPVVEMAQILFPLFDRVILAPIHTSRATSVEDLTTAAKATGSEAVIVESVREAIERAEKDAVDGVIVISGSVYLVGEARALLMSGRGART